MSQEPVFAKLVDAAVGGRADVVSQLLASDRGLATVRSGVECFVDAATHQLYAGDTALHMAAAASQRETIEYLLSAGADPNALDNGGVTPLHRAVRTRSSEAVRALLAGGADVSRRNGSGSTPLHLAVQDT